MNFVWNLDGVAVHFVTTNRWQGQVMWTSGIAFYKGDAVQWEATALAHGWYLVITSPSKKLGEFQGSTFNLPLEIAAAIRRLA